MGTGITGFADAVLGDDAQLRALGVSKITYNFSTGKWTATYPNPKYGTRYKDRWGYDRTDYTKTKTLNALSIEELKTKLASVLEAGAKKRADELKRKAAESIKKAEQMREQAEQAEKDAKVLLEMLEQ